MERCNTAQKPRDRQGGRRRKVTKADWEQRKAKVKQRPGGGRSHGKDGGREDGRGEYCISVTAAVFHPDTFPLNDDASKNMDLQHEQVRLALAMQRGNSCQEGRGTKKGGKEANENKERRPRGPEAWMERESVHNGQKGGGPGSDLMEVTAAVFHLDKSPLNDDAPLNMCLQAGQGRRQACAQCSTVQED